MSIRWSALVVFFSVAAAEAGDWPQFRGPDRTGVSKETGLLAAWPKEGPKLLFTYREAGMGFSSPSIVGDRLYTMGGWDDGEYVLCVDMKTKKEVWKTKLGKLFGHGRWGDGPRGTPTVDGDLIYSLGGFGDLVCVDKEGKEKWRKSLASDLGGEMMTEWGYSESPLVDGSHLIVTPGGAKGTVAALDKLTGAVVWRSEGLGYAAPYSSIVISNAAGVKQYIQNSYDAKVEPQEGYTSGIDAKTGKVLWTQQIFKKHSYAIAPTPIVSGDLVYVTSGYGGGCHCFQISKGDKGLEAKDLFDKKAQKTVKNTHGGVIMLDGKIYGHSEGLGWVCQDMKTGKIDWYERAELETRSGSITAAEGRLYAQTDGGVVALLEASPKGWAELGQFKFPEASKLRQTRETLQEAAVWTHPVIANGRLYLRDQELIFVYDIKK